MKFEELTLSQAATAITCGEVSSVELTQLLLQRIAKWNPSINAFIAVTGERALRDASQTDSQLKAGKYLGQLHGIPIAVKDLFETAGLRTTGGSRILANYVPSVDATVVRKLREQGAVLIGKTNLHEWAVGATNINPHYGSTRNPWDPSRVPGGSSGGSAATLAARMCLGALGTDTGGSIRIPSAACGVVGIKPTHGLVSTAGVMPFSWSMDHVGPMARNVEDCAILLDVISGYDPTDPESAQRATEEKYHNSVHRSIGGLRIAVPKNYFFDAMDDDVKRAVEGAVKTFEKSGANVSEITFPEVEEDVKASALIRLAEGATVHRKDLIERRSEIGSDVLERLDWGLQVSLTDYVHAKRVQALRTRARAQFFEAYDLLVTPTIPIEPPIIEGLNSVQAARELVRFTVPFNLAGLPAISIPCGFSRNRLPIGLQLVAGHWKEAFLFATAHSYEAMTDWTHKTPPGIQ